MKNTKTNEELGVENRAKILTFIADYRKEKGYVPSQAEVAREFKLTRQGARHHFRILADELKQYPEYGKYKGMN